MRDYETEWRDVVRDVDALADDSLTTVQLKACFAFEKLRRNWPGGNEDEQRRAIERYLTHPDVDDFLRIDFIVRVAAWDVVYNQGIPCQSVVIDDLKKNSELEEFYGIDVLKVYPRPEEGDKSLYNRVADRIVAKLDGDKSIDGKIAAQHVRTFFALGRDSDALHLLDEIVLKFNRSQVAFAAALEGGVDDWCLANVETLLNWNLHPGELKVPDDKVSPFVESIEDPDLKLTAQVFFAAAPDSALAARFKEHAFKRPLLAVHARDRLEKEGLIEPLNPDPAALEWFESIGQEQLRENAADMTELERLAVERYVNGMLDAGKASAVTAFYRQMDSVELSAENARWLSEIPLQREIALCEELLTGRSVSAPDRFVLISPSDRYQLQRSLDYLNRKSAGLSADMAGMNVAACYLGGRKEQLQDLKNVDGCSHERIFAGFTLLKGVQSGVPDEKKMKECIADFGAAMEYYKKQVSCGVIRHFNWYDVAAGILETYPYSLEPERWAAQLPELLPVALDPQRLEGFRMRRAQDKK